MDKMIGLKGDGETIWVSYIEFIAQAILVTYGDNLDDDAARAKMEQIDQMIIDAFGELMEQATRNIG